MGLLPLIMTQVSQFNENSDYNLRSNFHLENPTIHIVHFGNESILFLGAKSGNSFLTHKT